MRSSMDESVRRACPCLETLWQRIFSDKKASPDGTATAADGVGGGGDGGSEESRRGPGSVQQDKLPESGSVYTAMWAFEGRHEDELSFLEGDLFSVISRSGDWWTARRIDGNGRVLDTGIVPSNYLARAESLAMQP